MCLTQEVFIRIGIFDIRQTFDTPYIWLTHSCKIREIWFLIETWELHAVEANDINVKFLQSFIFLADIVCVADLDPDLVGSGLYG